MMSNDAIPKLRVIDGGGRAARPTVAPPINAQATEKVEAAAKVSSVSWLLVVLFLIAAVAGGAAVPLLQDLLLR
ncbi:hypothetical protein M8312_02395 [Sphingomonas sp. KRR8]|uniref:hypothetical protein n=1 Tax=Sphingomonas sp. KRR8 TaxID=2942996 RepID=UPI002020F33C|nr:hypothetical protein [Sphingomonas sp. KRR8]URD61384.1 hypothetical protein M8312_02395 [Sphingomonas sp. KRR8]